MVENAFSDSVGSMSMIELHIRRVVSEKWW